MFHDLILDSRASGRYSVGCVTNYGDKRVAAHPSSRKPINDHDIIQCEDDSNITGSCSWASIQSNDVVVQARCPTAQLTGHQMWLDDNLTHLHLLNAQEKSSLNHGCLEGSLPSII
jgi:hypothetical protein